ncbi:unnamed protein product [Prunus armeniaca]
MSNDDNKDLSQRDYFRLPKDVIEPLIELSYFFKELCAKVLREDDLNLLDNQIVITLCKLEKIFPLAFFDIMIHLTCHLAWEAKVADPVQFRWMYPVERYLHKLKTYVRNKAHLEGSIAEGVLGDECLIFCSRYLHRVETKFNKRDRNDNGGQPSYDTSPLSIFSTPGQAFGKGVIREKSIELHKAATHYVLKNCGEALPFVQEHRNILIQSSVDNVEESHRLQFSNWISKRGVLHETTCPQTPQHNGVAERKNGQILAATLALQLGASVPKRFWMDAVTYAVYLLNLLPSRVLDFQTPMCLVVSSMFTSIRIRGVSWTHVLFDVSLWVSLLIRKATDAIILQPDVYMKEPTEPAEPATLPEPATLTEPAILTDVTIVTKQIAPYEASLIVLDQAPLDIPEVSTSIHTSDNSYVLPPRQNRGVPPDRYSPKGKARYAIAHYVSDHRLSPECKAFVTRMDNIKIPTRVEEAFNYPKWAEAMNIEMEALQKNNT